MFLTPETPQWILNELALETFLKGLGYGEGPGEEPETTGPMEWGQWWTLD
jgi:hypothetical protein